MSGDTLDQLKHALVTLKELRGRLDAVERSRTEPIAVIGMGCRFPGGVNSPEAFWELLENGVDAISETPRDRWDVDSLYDPDPTTAGKITTRWGGFIDQVDQFDPYFFGISPREANRMDPQQRLLLEVAWEALENAGQTREGLKGSQTGVFVGVHSQSSDYYLMQAGNVDAMDTYTGTGTSHSVVSGRLSYLFDWQGPNIALDTACSSSLVATHLAVQSLRNKECNMALAGGVNIMLSPHFSIAASRMHMLSADGRCKAFDARADGFVRGEGCGVVVLKRLSDALADGDPILALIRGSAINQDGNTNGLTAPNSLSQEAVIRAALANAGVTPEQIGYIETHGTGTSLGDPIEIEALTAVLGRNSKPCFLGSAKTNLGHLEGAAGVAGLIKAVLTLQHRAVPPLVHFTQLNPHISLENTSFHIPTSLTAWEEDSRFSGVSSFGWSGTNAHIILEQAPVLNVEAQEQDSEVLFLPISARAPEALLTVAGLYRNFLAETEVPLSDIGYTASLRRSHHDHRLVVIGHSQEELVSHLDTFLRGEIRPGMAAGAALEAGLVFVFPGQGGQWLGMGRQLLEHEPTFREALERCKAAMKPYVNWSLLEQLTTDETQSRLDEIDVVQPVLFAIQVALAALWRSWGIEPQAVVGHSLGEVAAAQVAGILSLEDAAHVICRRSQLMKRVSGRGAMAVTELSLEDARTAIQGYENRLSIAVSNSPRSTVLSGDPAALEEVMQGLKQQGVFCRHVKVDVAAHSPHMEPLRPELVRELAGIKPQAGSVPMISTVTGTVQEGNTFDAGYWGQNLRQPVLFATAMQKLVEEGFNIFIEIGPHPVLLPAIEGAWQSSDLRLFASMRREDDEQMVMWGALGGLHCAGYPVDWRKWYPAGRHVGLPTYPWQHERFWLDFETQGIGFGTANGPQEMASNPLLGWRLNAAIAAEVFVWENAVDRRKFPYLYANRTRDLAVMPASAFFDMAVAAAHEAFHIESLTLAEFAIHQSLPLPDDSITRLQLVLAPGQQGASFRIYARTEDRSWTLHASGKIYTGGSATFEGWLSLPDFQEQCERTLAGQEFYEQLNAQGVLIGDSLRGMKSVWVGNGEALSQLETAKNGSNPEASFHLASVLMSADVPEIYTPNYIQELRVLDPANQPSWCFVRLHHAEETESITHDIAFFDEDGHVLMELEGVRLRRLDADVVKLEDWFYEIQWQPGAHQDQPGDLPGGDWLVFADRSGVGDALASQLQAMGQRCVLVYAGDDYTSANDEHFQIRPSRAEDISQLFQDSFPQHHPAHVVHLWSLDAPSVFDQGGQTLHNIQASGCDSVLHLVQHIAGAGSAEPPHLWLVTQGVQAVAPDVKPSSVVQSLLWGFGRVIAEEHRELWGGLIDLPGDVSSQEAAVWLLQEVQCYDGEDQVAYHDGKRYVARFVRPQKAHDPLPILRFRPDASYLITGGLGGIALRVARWMAENGARRLILMGRTPLPPRADWQQADPDSLTGRRIAAVRELETMGVSVHLAAVDVADEAQLRPYLEQYSREGWPAIRGVMHTAALIQDRLISQLDSEGFRHVFGPKVIGSYLLHELLGDDLDFFVLFSSLGAVLGQTGQGNYAAANAFLDALAYYRQSKGLPALSINWGGWADLGLAMTAGAQRTIQYLESQGIISFTPEQGVAALEHLMQRQLADLGAPQAAVMPMNWSKFRKARLAASQSRLLMDLSAESAETRDGAGQPSWQRSSIRDELLAADGEQRRDLLQSYLQRLVAQVLKLDPSRVEPTKPLGLLGIDSLMALELRNRLEADLGVPFSATLVWNYPTVSEMIPHVAGKIDVSLSVENVSAVDLSGKSSQKETRLDNVLEGLDDLSDEEALNRLLGKG